MSEDLESHFKEVQSLNLTARVRHILDGESDIVPDDDDIPSPINHTNITNKDTQEDVGEEQHNVGGTPNLGNDGHNENNSMGNPTPAGEENEGTGGEPTEGKKVRKVLTALFSLSVDDQGTTVLQYKQSIDKLLAQNQRLTAMVHSVNAEREKMAVQVNTAMEENHKLLDALKERPNVHSIRKEICEEYDELMKNLIKDKHKELVEEKELHQKQLTQNETNFDGLLTKALNKVKNDYDQKLKDELEKSNRKLLKEHRVQQALITSLNDEVAKLKRCKPVPAPRDRSHLSSASNVVSDKLGNLCRDIFDYCPGTVKTTRGGACDNTSIDWTEHSHKVQPSKHVTFSTSTPLKSKYANLTDQDVLAVPLIAKRGSGQKSGLNTKQSTLNILANEFKKLNPPKLQKLRGGTSPSAQLFFSGWVKELKAIIKDRDLTESESIQLVREFTESKAQQVDFYLDTSPIQNVEGLLEHLTAAFSSGEDEAGIKSEFYSREQLPKETKDDFAEALQILASKILIINPNFQSECNSALINQFASGLRARDLIS